MLQGRAHPAHRQREHARPDHVLLRQDRRRRDATATNSTHSVVYYSLHTHARTTCLLPCTGEIDYNELAGLIMTGDILGRSRWLRAASRQRHSPAQPSPASSDGSAVQGCHMHSRGAPEPPRAPLDLPQISTRFPPDLPQISLRSLPGAVEPRRPPELSLKCSPLARAEP